MNNKVLARKLFHRLEKGFSRSEYIVLNDGYYYASIWADSEEEAIQECKKIKDRENEIKIKCKVIKLYILLFYEFYI